MLASSPSHGLSFELSPGETSDAKIGLEMAVGLPEYLARFLAADRGYDSNAIRDELDDKGIEPIIPMKKNRTNYRELNEIESEIYKKRNEVERLFGRLKNFRRIFSRYDKLDLMYSSWVMLGMMVLNLRDLC